MPSSPFRLSTLALSLALSLLAACGGGTNGPTTCTSQAQCGAGLVCTLGECVAPGMCPSTVQSCRATSECPAASECTEGCCAAVQGCATSADCVDPGRPTCDTATHACKACTSNSQCPANKACTAAGRCETTCAADADCQVAGKSKCRATGTLNLCSECVVNADCAGTPSKPVCKEGSCFGCASDASCGGATPTCDDATKACVPCLESRNSGGRNAACADPKPACVAQACVECAPSANAAGTGANGACPAGKPVCAPTNTCVGCTDTSQCSGGAACDPGTKTCKAIVLSSLAPESASVGVGGTLELTATLSAPATAAASVAVVVVDGGGSLSSATIAIAVGASSGKVTYTAPGAGGTAHVKASFGGVDKTSTVTITSAALSITSVTASAANVAMGGTATITVALSRTPDAPATVTLALGNAAHGTLTAGGAPATSVTLNIPTNATSATATFTAACPLPGDVAAQLTASMANATDKVLSLPLTAPKVLAVLPSYAQVAGAGTQPITVVLDQLVACDVPVPLQAGSGTVPASVTIPAGMASGRVDYTAANSVGNDQVLANYNLGGGAAKAASLQVPPTVASVTPAATTVIAVTETTDVTVTLGAAAPAGGTVVYLATGKTGLSTGTLSQTFKYAGTAPGTVVIPAGQTSATFTFNPCVFRSSSASDITRVSASTASGAAYSKQTPDITVTATAQAAGTAKLCPITPFQVDHPLVKNSAGKWAPLVFNVSVNFTATSPTGGTVSASIVPILTAGCGTMTPAAGTQLTATTGTTARAQFSFNPADTLTLGDLPKTCVVSLTTPNTVSATVRLVAPGPQLPADHLLINKIDADGAGSQASSEIEEYVEIYNPTAGTISLANYKLLLIASNNDDLSAKAVGTAQDLSAAGSLPAGGRLIVADKILKDALTATASYKTMELVAGTGLTGTTKLIRDNVSVVALWDGSKVIDSVSFGPTFGATGSPLAAATNFPLTGPALDPWIYDSNFLSGAMVRLTDGYDTGNVGLDWRFSTAHDPITATSTVSLPNDVKGP